MIAICKQYSQGIYVGLSALTSFVTLGYIIKDSYNIEKKQIENKYNDQIKKLNLEIDTLRSKLN